jgi:hypothetical protein
VDEATESPKKRSGVRKAIASVKQIVSGTKEAGSPVKDGARPLSSFERPVNRAEVVIAVRPPKRQVSQTVAPPLPSVETDSVLADSSMGPPSSSSPSIRSFPPSTSPSIRSFAPSTSSRQPADSRKRHRGDEYELSRLRHDFNASQEELALVKRQYAGYRESTEAYIKELHRELGAPSDEEAEPKWKGKGRAM